MNLIKVLSDVGLTDKEAKVYLALLELNDALPSTISRRAMIKRPTVYVTLESLLKRGLVSRVKKNSVWYYRAVDPSSVYMLQEKKTEQFHDSLPELMNLKLKFQITPQMSVFEGAEGIIQIMEDTLTTKTGILCWSNTDLAVHTLLTDYHPDYLKKKIQKGIISKCLFLYDKTALDFKKKSKEQLREVYLIPKEKFPFENEINIYDDKISIISHADQVGVIIQNKSVANTQRAIFDFAFEYAKTLEDSVLTPEDKAYLAD